jgi:hypothetical protein
MQNIDITIKPSKLYIGFIFSTLCVSGYAVYYSPLWTWSKILLIFLAICYGLHLFFRHVFLCTDNSILGIRLLSNGSWMLFTKEKAMTGELSGDTTVTHLVVILRFIISGSWYKHSCVIFQDALDPAVYRNLLVQLRCQ